MPSANNVGMNRKPKVLPPKIATPTAISCSPNAFDVGSVYPFSPLRRLRTLSSTALSFSVSLPV